MDAGILLFPTSDGRNVYSVGNQDKKRPVAKTPLCAITYQDKAQDGAENYPPWPAERYHVDQAAHALYVRPDMSAIMLTAVARALPDEITNPVLPGGEPRLGSKPFTMLTREMYCSIMAYLDSIPATQFPPEKREEIARRWDTIREWAEAEGWTREGTG